MSVEKENKQEVPFNDAFNSFRESIDAYPPTIKYPALVMLAEIITEELPKAKVEYDNAIKDIVSRFFRNVK